MGSSSAREDGKHLILLGTHGIYIHSVLFDPVAKTLEHVGKRETSQDPSWLTKHPRLKDIVYSNGHVKGKVFCLRVSADGDIEVLDEATSGGKGPTHLAVNQDYSALLIAHASYGQDASGLLSTVPLDPETGRFLLDHAPPSQFFHPTYTKSDHPRLDAPHVHHVMTHGTDVITCDLGCNKLWRLRQGGEEDSARWVVSGVVDGFDDGDGPRHAVIHPNGKFVYVLNEVSSTLSVHTLPSSPDVASQRLYRHTLLPDEDQPNKEMTAAEIVLLPPLTPSAPSLLILTNRFSTSSRGDALALFEVDDSGEAVQPAKSPHYWGIGKHIRALEGDASGKYICTAGRDQGGVVILERVGDGTELQEVCRLDVPNVVVPVWLS